jgi:hypothetical protein
MKAGSTIAYIAAAVLIFFGVLFIWGAFDPETGSIGWIAVGIVSIGVGLVLIWLARRKDTKQTVEVIQKIDLSGDIDLEKFTCDNCGGQLTSDNLKMVAGAPVVNCPFCGTEYQLSEEPKW